jgi:predicted SAM-dependent methyltransferase
MELKKKLYKLFPTIPKTNLLIGQKLYSIKLKLIRPRVKQHLAGKENIYTNIGCGDAGLSNNWVNIDYTIYKNVTYAFDCRKELPFAPGSVKGIFCEHFFEHLDYITEVPDFLAACFKSLQINGMVRIIVPDAEKYLFGYCSEGWNILKKVRPLDENLKDIMMGIQYQTKIQLINEVFRQGGEHKYAWDFETIKLAFINAGFTRVFKMEYLKSNDQQLAIDMAIRQSESLYVEAIK